MRGGGGARIKAVRTLVYPEGHLPKIIYNYYYMLKNLKELLEVVRSTVRHIKAKKN